MTEQNIIQNAKKTFKSERENEVCFIQLQRMAQQNHKRLCA